jgi:hypothetical protein
MKGIKMIYLEETLNLKGASPEALDDFIAFSQETMVPVCKDVGARLIAAWTSNEEWYGQVKQYFEFDDLNGLKAFRINASQNRTWGVYTAGVEEYAPVRRMRLLEPAGAVPPEVLHQAIAESQQSPNFGYGLATLEVADGKMDAFLADVAVGHKRFPIIACWRPIGGSPNEVIDVWKTPEPAKAYVPADNFRKKFMRSVRATAPKERVVRMIALPYSPLL